MISVIIPVYNEEKNLSALNTQLKDVLESLNGEYEIIYVDDGSNDNSNNILAEFALNNKKIKLINLIKNYGQSLAISAGIEHSQGDILILMDADLQNDPKDIPRLLSKLKEGYDIVSGWRNPRRDPLFTKIIPSFLANKIVSLISGLNLHDIGCSLKAYKKDAIKNIKLYGEMHRLLPIYAQINGTKIAEVKVSHNYRVTGKSKYGLSRIFKIILDLITIKFSQKFYTKPIYFFGFSGMFFIFLGTLIGAFIIIRKIFLGGVWISPLLFISIILFTMGLQMIFLGLLAEILIKIYYKPYQELHQETPYIIKSVIEDRLIKKI